MAAGRSVGHARNMKMMDIRVRFFFISTHSISASAGPATCRNNCQTPYPTPTCYSRPKKSAEAVLPGTRHSASMRCMEHLEERIIELEIRSTHQERLIEELNEVVTSSWRRIDQLERELRLLKDVLKDVGPDLVASPDE
ncbi:MAG: hypothetical protein C0616_00610 [Desulfuromonas sp.]|nr:MAG: hypothetical protein C0616_00610 [Desulfuromonas sp.]